MAALFGILFLAILAAPVIIPVALAAKSKTMALPVKVGLIVAGALTALYTVTKYGEALDHDSDFKGFRVFALPPVEYVFAAYSIAAVVSGGKLIHRARSARLRQSGTLAPVLTLAACVALGVTFGRAFMRLPFGDDILSKKQLRAEPDRPAHESQPFRLLANTNVVEAGSRR
jgi:hypothetical protein